MRESRRPRRRANARHRHPPARRPMIGIRPDFSGDEVPQGGTAKFSVIAARSRRQARRPCRRAMVAGQGRAQLPVVPRRQLLELRAGDLHQAGRQRHGRHHRRRRGRPLSLPVDWGRYRLEVETADPAGPGDELRVRRRLVCRGDLDRDAGRAGNRARQGKLRGRRHGQAARSRRALPASCWSPSAPRSCSKTITASDSGRRRRPSTFRSATTGAPAPMSRRRCYRPGDAQETRMPARAIGVKWLTVDPADKKLGVALDAAGKDRAAPGAVDPGLGRPAPAPARRPM